MTLRVIGPGEVTRDGRGAAEDVYVSRLVKLVPAEAVSMYPFFHSYASNFYETNFTGPRPALYIVAWVFLAAIIIFRWAMTSSPGHSPQYGAILITAIAFVIWVHVMKGDFGLEMVLKKPPTDGLDAPRAIGGMGDIKELLSNLMLWVWTFLAPVVYRGEGRES